MPALTWQLQQPLNAIIFDCDGTLSQIEGINLLATMNQVGTKISKMTEIAMSKTGLNHALYAQRLALVQPTMTQIATLSEEYFMAITPGVSPVIQLLQRLGKSIYILSAGIHTAVVNFGRRLQIPEAQIFAVKVFFNEIGHYVGFDETSPLIHNQGKRFLLETIQQQHQYTLFIGDGLNDYAAHDVVTRFIGFGGTYFRPNLAKLCQFYITTHSMLPLLPLSLTKQEYERLNSTEQEYYRQGMQAITAKKVYITTRN